MTETTRTAMAEAANEGPLVSSCAELMDNPGSDATGSSVPSIEHKFPYRIISFGDVLNARSNVTLQHFLSYVKGRPHEKVEEVNEMIVKEGCYYADTFMAPSGSNDHMESDQSQDKEG